MKLCRSGQGWNKKTYFSLGVNNITLARMDLAWVSRTWLWKYSGNPCSTCVQVENLLKSKHQYFRWTSIYINFVCLSICWYPNNVKTAEPIRTNFCVGPCLSPRKICRCSELRKVVFKSIWFLWNYKKLGFKGASCPTSISTFHFGFICAHFLFVQYKNKQKICGFHNFSRIFKILQK